MWVASCRCLPPPGGTAWNSKGPGAGRHSAVFPTLHAPLKNFGKGAKTGEAFQHSEAAKLCDVTVIGDDAG